MAYILFVPVPSKISSVCRLIINIKVQANSDPNCMHHTVHIPCLLLLQGDSKNDIQSLKLPTPSRSLVCFTSWAQHPLSPTSLAMHLPHLPTICGKWVGALWGVGWGGFGAMWVCGSVVVEGRWKLVVISCVCVCVCVCWRGKVNKAYILPPLPHSTNPFL